MSLRRENLELVLINAAFLLGRASKEGEIFTIEVPILEELQPLLHKIDKTHPRLLGNISFDTNGPKPYSKELDEYFSIGLTSGSIERADSNNYMSIICNIETHPILNTETEKAGAELAKIMINKRREIPHYWRPSNIG